MTSIKLDRLIQILNLFRVNGIRNGGKGLELVLEFQDIVGRSTNEEIRHLWEELGDFMRSNFVWALTSTVSYDMAINVITVTVGRDAQIKVLKDLDNEYEALQKREIEINDRLHAVEKREAEVEKVVAAQKSIQEILNAIHG